MRHNADQGYCTSRCQFGRAVVPSPLNKFVALASACSYSARFFWSSRCWVSLAVIDVALSPSNDAMKRIGYTRMQFRLWLLCLLLASVAASIRAQETTEQNVVVSARESGEEFEEPGGYGQPQWAERSRASATTKLYVLSPNEIFVGILTESDFFRHGTSQHDLVQEIELGLPNRFEIGFENHVGLKGDDASQMSANLGARYAFGAWGKIPLNPTISAEYRFATGKDLTSRFERTFDKNVPDAYELRLLLGQEFIPRVQWAANLFFQHEIGGARNHDVGFTQDIAYLAVADKFEIAAEMRYTNATRRAEKRASANEFVIGPSANWKPNLHTVISIAPLFGCTADSPRVAVLGSVSLEFGGGESKTVPINRNRVRN